MNVRHISLLRHVLKNLEELIDEGRRLGPLYVENPKLVADITRKAKWLRKAIQTFQESQDQKKPA